MKTNDQIYRYTSRYRFSKEDWGRVVSYCRERGVKGRIYKARPGAEAATFEEFADWMENGFGIGDYVSYGSIAGIMGDGVGERVELVAYLDLDGNLLMRHPLKVEHPERLKLASARQIEKIREGMSKRDKAISTRDGVVVEMYTPKKYSHVVAETHAGEMIGIGMYSHTENCEHKFILFNTRKGIESAASLDSNCTSLREASEKEKSRFLKAAASKGLHFNKRVGKFVKVWRKGAENVYWYMNDRFDVIQDLDDDAPRHVDRFKAGNYFIDLSEALDFSKRVQELAKGKHGEEAE